MKLVIIVPPYNDEAGKGVPPSEYQWMADTFMAQSIQVQLLPLGSYSELEQAFSHRMPDLVYSPAFSTLKTLGDKAVVIHQFLDQLGIPYIGSPAEALELALSKIKLKLCLLDHGITTPDFHIYRFGDLVDPSGDPEREPARYPYILKPSREGNSRGISERSIVRDKQTLDAQLEMLSTHFPEILVEHYLGDDPEMREFTVAMIGNGRERLNLPAEIFLLSEHLNRIITTADKNQHKTRALPVEDPKLRRKLANLADQVFDAVEVRDYARCDILSSKGKLHVIEVNGQPMLPDLWFDACASSTGFNRRDYLLAILEAAIARYRLADVPGFNTI
jgi:D-alanine-D-alanine ligase